MPPSNVYVLVKEAETVEVMHGREARRDQLIAAGYKWVNQPGAASPAKPQRRYDVTAVSH